MFKKAHYRGLFEHTPCEALEADAGLRRPDGAPPRRPAPPTFAPSLTCDYLVTYLRAMDDVFKALADPTRRSLLDELFREDGQTLTALESRVT